NRGRTARAGGRRSCVGARPARDEQKAASPHHAGTARQGTSRPRRVGQKVGRPHYSIVPAGGLHSRARPSPVEAMPPAACRAEQAFLFCRSRCILTQRQNSRTIQSDHTTMATHDDFHQEPAPPAKKSSGSKVLLILGTIAGL